MVFSTLKSIQFVRHYKVILVTKRIAAINIQEKRNRHQIFVAIPP